jgi:hypothetical protein
MNARTIRRAIERKETRKAQKQARNEAAQALAAAPGSSAGSFDYEEAHDESRTAVSESRLDANRRNAQFSTGPKTEAGKSVSSRNAVKTALTGRTVLLPTDDADRYEAHCQSFAKELSPEGQRETILAQSLADIAWRIERIASFEMAIYAKGRAQFAGAHQNEPDAIRAALIEHDIYQANERELRNLHLQEARLRRQRDKDIEELRHLQTERRAAAREQLELAALACKQARQEDKPFDPAALGFVFSTPEIERFLQLQALSPSAPQRSKAA